MGSLSRFSSAISRVGRLRRVSAVERGGSLTRGLMAVERNIRIVSIMVITILLTVDIFVVRGAVGLAICSEHLRVDVVGSINTAGKFIHLPFIIRNVVLNIVSNIVSLNLI